MGKNGKILTKEHFKILDISLLLYQTRCGLKMIQIENTFYNIYDTKTINRIKDKMSIDKKYELEYVII